MVSADLIDLAVSETLPDLSQEEREVVKKLVLKLLEMSSSARISVKEVEEVVLELAEGCRGGSGGVLEEEGV